MSEYIKREDVLDFLSGIYDCNDMVFKNDICDRTADCSSCRWRDTKAFIASRIARFPAADVVEKKKGEWKVTPLFIKCSLCGESFMLIPQNYCPNCGADMRGQDAE